MNFIKYILLILCVKLKIGYTTRKKLKKTLTQYSIF